jgi:16S rRNA (uracil1498-N3)-methyltransferase
VVSDIKSDFFKNLEHNIFYIPPENIVKYSARVTGDDIHYLLDVLRKNKSEILQFTDGQGGLYEASIARQSRASMELKIRNYRSFKKEGCNIALAFVPLKGTRSEFILEKTTELGVGEFHIFFSKNSVVNRISDNKLARFNSIVKQAMIQSRRLFLPSVKVCNDIDTIIKQFGDFDKTYIMDIEGSDRINAAERKTLIVIGPEGGFEEFELNLFRERGAELITLGEYRLRSETAAIAAVALTLNATR